MPVDSPRPPVLLDALSALPQAQRDGLSRVWPVSTPLAALRTIRLWLGAVIAVADRQRVVVTPPYRHGDRLIMFWDKAAPAPAAPTPLPAAGAYKYSPPPRAGYHFNPQPPPTWLYHVEASLCGACGRPSLWRAHLSHRPPVPVWSRLFCTRNVQPSQVLTTAMAPRFRTVHDGLEWQDAVPASRIPFQDVCETPQTALHPAPGWVQSLRPPDPLALPASMAPLTALVNNLGGLPHQTDLLHSWILGLHPDVLLLQETSNRDAVKAALPDHYQAHVSQVSGPGAGCVIAWRRAHVPARDHTVLHDCIDWLAVLLPLASHGTTLAVSVHFRPKLSSAAQRRHLQHIGTVESTTKPTLLLLGGDFNSAVAPGTALHAALSPQGCLGHAQRLLPDGTLTHFSRRGPILTATAIDHVFA